MEKICNAQKNRIKLPIHIVSQLLVCNFSETFLIMQARKLDPDSNILLNNDLNLSLNTSNGFGFKRLLVFIYNETRRCDSLSRNPITVAELEVELASTLLFALEEQRGRPDNHYDALSAACITRAEEFIDANLCKAVTLADIAAAADVPSRTLRRAFTKHRGMSPICFLRKRRLERTHKEQRFADPGSTSVTEVALKYGFLELGRFAS